VLTDPKTSKRTVTNPITANGDANHVRHWLYLNPTGYYFWRRGLGHHLLKVDKVFDKATNVATYTVSLPYQQNGPAVSAITVLKGTSKSKIEVTDPVKLGKVGGPPITGKFVVQCKNAAGALSTSNPIDLWAGNNDIENAIGGKCDGLRNKIRVTKTSMYYNHWTVGT
jgi:hypothetical protein